MKPFTRNEIIGVTLILGIIFFFTIFNLKISIRRSRDAQRRADINSISEALNNYQKDFGFFPPSTPDGKILACKGDNFETLSKEIPLNDKRNYFFKMLRACRWGEDSLRDVNDDKYDAYLKTLPKDPKADEGYEYLYISNTNRYQLFAYLEGGKEEVGYRQGIVSRNLHCGSYICNFGKAFGETPLEKTIEEYENEIRKTNEK